jgi:hypothetical protein
VTEQWQLPGVQCRLGTCNTAARPEGLHVLLLVDAGREGSTISRLHERVGDAAAALCGAQDEVAIVVNLTARDGGFL